MAFSLNLWPPSYPEGGRRTHNIGVKMHSEKLKFIQDATKTNIDDCILWPWAKVQGYAKMKVQGKVISVSRRVCIEAHGEPPEGKNEAAHSCVNKHCINRNHLSWKSRVENEKDKIRDGTTNRGERSHLAKLTNRDVRIIRYRLRKGEYEANIALDYGVAELTILDIKQRKTWKYI